MSGTIKNINGNLSVARSQLADSLEKTLQKKDIQLEKTLVAQLFELTTAQVNPAQAKNVAEQLQRILEVIPKTEAYQELRTSLQEYSTHLLASKNNKSPQTSSPLATSGAPVKQQTVTATFFDGLERHLKMTPFERLLKALRLNPEQHITDKVMAWVSENPNAIKDYLMHSSVEEICTQLKAQTAKLNKDQAEHLFSTILSSCLVAIPIENAQDLARARQLIAQISNAQEREFATFAIDPRYAPLSETLKVCERQGNKKQLFKALCRDLGPSAPAIDEVWHQLFTDPITKKALQHLELKPDDIKEFLSYYETFDHQAFNAERTLNILAKNLS